MGQVVWVETVSSQLANHETKVILWNCLTVRVRVRVRVRVGVRLLCFPHNSPHEHDQ